MDNLDTVKPHELNDDAYIVVNSDTYPRQVKVRIKDLLLYLEVLKNSTI